MHTWQFLYNYHTRNGTNMKGGGGIPLWLPYSSCVTAIQFPCGSHAASVWLPKRVVGHSRVAPIQPMCSYHTAPMYLPYSFTCGSHTGWWGYSHVWLPYSSHVSPKNSIPMWLPYRLVGGFLCVSHIAPMWLPYRVVGTFLCGYHTAPMCLPYNSHVAPERAP